jgi:5-methylcytosine-specific restriction endonuclease McrA
VVWGRDGCQCVSPLQPPLCTGKPRISLKRCHIDHIKSGKRGTNDLTNLRTLCPTCHALRADNRHRGMIARALHDGIIPPNWRELVWGN